MTLVTDILSRLTPGARDRHHGLRSSRLVGSPQTLQAPRPRGDGIAPKGPEAVVRMEARRDPRILQARRVIGTRVFDASGAKAGRITDLSIDKRTGRVVYALIGIEGGLGFLKRLSPAPWALLRYDAAKGGYVTPADRNDLADGPTLTPEELQSLGAGDDAWRARLAIYDSPYLTLPFI
jgi:hypothetical protein